MCQVPLSVLFAMSEYIDRAHTLYILAYQSESSISFVPDESHAHYLSAFMRGPLWTMVSRPSVLQSPYYNVEYSAEGCVSRTWAYPCLVSPVGE